MDLLDLFVGSGLVKMGILLRSLVVFLVEVVLRGLSSGKMG